MKRFTIFFQLKDERIAWAQVEACLLKTAVGKARKLCSKTVYEDSGVHLKPDCEEFAFIGSVEGWGDVRLEEPE